MDTGACSATLLQEASDEYASGMLVDSQSSDVANNNYIKAAKIAPDGSSVLSASEDTLLRLYALDQEALNAERERRATAGGSDAKAAALRPWTCAYEGECIFDFAWYPLFAADDLSSACFASTSRGHPIHLFNALDGSLRTSYLPYNAFSHEPETALSLAFHPQGQVLFAGSRSCVKVFDVMRPGTQIEDRLLATRRKAEGQRGLVSCFAFPTAPSSADEKLYAVGTYSKTVCIYSEEHQGARQPVCWLEDADQPMGGVTQLAWVGDHHVVSGHRQDRCMRLWDLRKPEAVLRRFPRVTTTCQRFRFDVCVRKGQTVVATGDLSGRVSLFDLNTGETISRFQAHARACTSVGFHPSANYVVTSSGERLFPSLTHLASRDDQSAAAAAEDENMAESESGEDGSPPAKRQRRSTDGPQPAEGSSAASQPLNCIRVWQIHWGGSEPQEGTTVTAEKDTADGETGGAACS
ncbi:unnamed protein product [Vitrella brassicaformis CCMP3155]|uniref:Uncharacterized protein n=1 Tax=Vitrella brassicaformis (strain CCMP3155) TaxID=1169540 RepID=A0A0G4FER1_VITBC|nr:unnamed protein product [Vitrella brassicaformis CCMP3155]|mmetsp:Transcript_35452/g.101880  ORF Transcript_35452/g.101880 Transcript_35452/m.101880 type:complete len:466 (+) Transcript_35452:357-1754(+)|eukprot:CEM11297.1 unnamed protein product [Vitrella brassicaformis CCMP3155]